MPAVALRFEGRGALPGAACCVCVGGWCGEVEPFPLEKIIHWESGCVFGQD